MTGFFVNKKAGETFPYTLNKEAIKRGRTLLNPIDQACFFVGMMFAFCVGYSILLSADVIYSIKLVTLTTLLSLVFAFSTIHSRISCSVGFVERQEIYRRSY